VHGRLVEHLTDGHRATASNDDQKLVRRSSISAPEARERFITLRPNGWGGTPLPGCRAGEWPGPGCAVALGSGVGGVGGRARPEERGVALASAVSARFVPQAAAGSPPGGAVVTGGLAACPAG
jgi:hypothetical protein